MRRLLPCSLAAVVLAAATVALPGRSAEPGPSAKGEKAKPPAAKPPAAKPPEKTRVLVTISKETTYITGPLDHGGYPDYIAALNQRWSRGVTPENNAAVPFWRAMGPAPLSERVRDRYFKMLGIPPLPEKDDYFVTLGDYAKQVAKPGPAPPDAEEPEDPAEKVYDQLHTAMDRPWPKKEFPVLAGWLAVNRKPMVLLVEASRRPRRYEPLIAVGDCDEPGMLIAVLLPAIQQYREAARALVLRATLRMKEGKTDEAWEDLLACHRLARLAGQGPTLIDALVGIAIDGIACSGDRALLQYGPLTAAQASKMKDDLDKLPPVTRMADKIDPAERFMFLDCTCMLARTGLSHIGRLADGAEASNVVETLVDWAARWTIDWDLILRTGNTWYDRMADAMGKPTRPERMAATDKIEEDLHKLAQEAKDPKSLAFAFLGNPRQAVSERIGQIMISLLLPAVTAAGQAEDRGAMQFDVTRLGFALAAYRAEHGSYPAGLADLAPKYVKEVPKDIFSDGDLHYKPEGAGYLLYSVGRNGEDDGGKGREERENAGDWTANDWDDLAIRVPAAEPPKQNR